VRHVKKCPAVLAGCRKNPISKGKIIKAGTRNEEIPEKLKTGDMR